MDAVLTVGLPLYKASKIYWLAMEGLCRQVDAPPWELIVYEEIDTEDCEIEDTYGSRLRDAGCVRIYHRQHDNRMFLHPKWVKMAQWSRSPLFLLQAADCYSYPGRLLDSAVAFEDPDVTWIDQDKGFFYRIRDGAMVVNDHDRHTTTKTALNMAVPTDILKAQDPDPIRPNGIDHHIFTWVCQCQRLKRAKIGLNGTWMQGVDTTGLNTISKRDPFIDEALGRIDMKRAPHVTNAFRPPTQGERLALPAEIWDRLRTYLDAKEPVT